MLAFTSRSLIHFELIFDNGVHVDIQFSQHHLLKKLSFSPLNALEPLSKSVDHKYKVYF